jgi:hypothetical protein
VEKRLRDALNRIAAEQRGLFSVAQATNAGISNAQLLRARSSGTLRRVRRGIYTLEGAPASPWEELIAAALVAGPGAVVSHESAAAVHRFEYGALGSSSVELTLLEGAYSRPPGVVVHRHRDLTHDDVMEKRGVLLTSPCRTLLDLAGRLGPAMTEKTLDEGLIQRRWTVAQMRDCVGRARSNFAGRGHFEQLISLRSEEPSADSELEAKVFRALRPLGPYVTHFPVVIEGQVYVLDAAWPEYMVGVEIVGRSHRLASRSAFDRERRKLNALAGSGWRIAHLTAAMAGPEMRSYVDSLVRDGPLVDRAAAWRQAGST